MFKYIKVKPKIIPIIGKKIQITLVLVCLIIALLCAGFAYLSKSLFTDFRKQKEHYRFSTEILLETNNLVSQFYNVQEYANLFLVQKEARYLNIYQTEIDTLQQKLDYIAQILMQEDSEINFENILTLLHEKKVLLKKLQNLFVNKNDIDSLYNKLAAKIEEEINKETQSIIENNMSMLQDTVWQAHKTFGQRLKDAFQSSKKRGKEIASINTVIIKDNLMQESLFATPLLDSLQELAHRYQYQYATKIERIEIELYALLSADRYITKEITSLLLQLHEEMLLNVILLGEEYESNAQQALLWSVVLGAVALLFITTFIIFIFRNIKMIRKIHDALRLEKQKTEELMENRHQLLLAISHDIKTPLNALLGYLELWGDETLSPAQLRELNTMQYSGKYILALLNNLLEFTRLEQKKTQIIQENIEIVPFFMEIMEMFQPLCNENNNSLSYNINIVENPQILIDSLKLKQITVNLISNAVKYTTKGEISVRVEEIGKPDLHLKVTISDTGKGIPKEKLYTLFEPFTRGEKNSAGIEGSGLGLFVVKGLIDVMGGTIKVETEENQGTVVTFSIPFEDVLENTQTVLPQRQSLNIWVIEDDAVQLQVIVSMLQKLGHTAITSQNKESFETTVETLRATSLHDINLIFTDLEMGDLNGYEVLQSIKSQFNIPVICCSGNITTSKIELQQLGFDDFLEKPFTLNQIEKILSSIHKQKMEISPDLFSLSTLNELLNNDQKTISELLNTFAQSLPNDIQLFEQALAEENLMLIHQTAHRILPFCKQIVAHEVIPILEKIELSKKQNDIQFKNLKIDTILLVNNLKKLLIEIKKTQIATMC